MKKYDLTNSAECYKDKTQAEAYLNLFKNTGYKDKMVSGEFGLIQNNLEIILNHFTNKTHYVDLGPGLGDKSELILKHAKLQDRINLYTEIDIQDLFLEITGKKIEKLQIPVQKIKNLFEEGLQQLKGNLNPKFIYLGCTHRNFKSEQINNMLYTNMNSNDYVYISSEVFPQDINQVIKNYSNEYLEHISKPLIRKLNLKKSTIQFNVEFNHHSSQIEVGYIIKTQTNQYNKGDFLVCLISKKSTPNEFKESICSHFNGIYFKNETNIAFIGSKKNSIIDN